MIKALLDAGQYVAVYILSRYLYRIGKSELSDEEYDKLEMKLKETNPELKNYFERTYDDDPVPYTLLAAVGLSAEPKEVDNDMYKFLEEEKSFSINAVRSMIEVYEFCKNNSGKPIMCSLKLDGVNVKSLWCDGEYRLSLSRGRASNSLDYTKGAKYVMPGRVMSDHKLIKITGECYASDLEYLRSKYGKDYKTAKSSAISMLRIDHQPSDYKYLHFRAFSCEGVEFGKVSEMYDWLESMGFDTPPHFIIDDVPEDFDKFQVYMQDVMQRMAELGKGLPADGMVMEVDDLVSEYKERGQYSERQIAAKFGPWGFSVYEGEVVDIVFEQQRVFKSTRIRIKPVTTHDGCEAEWINGFNPDIIIKNGINIGSIIQFERNSDAVNELITVKDANGFD